MPRNGIIGICLQTLAGLIFIVDQIWEKVIERDVLKKLKALLDEPSFQQKIPILAIPIISPFLLIMYFKFGTNSKWYDAFFSISMAVAVSSGIYFIFINAVSRLLKRIKNMKSSLAKRANSNPFLWSNLILLIVSFIVLIGALLLLYPLSQVLAGPSILVALPSALYLTLLMFISYGFLLSLMYFILYGFLKLGIVLRRIRLGISEYDKVFSRRLIWLFLILFWIWGGVLLIINSL